MYMRKQEEITENVWLNKTEMVVDGCVPVGVKISI